MNGSKPSAAWLRVTPYGVALLAVAVYVAPATDVPFYTKGEAREAVLVQAMVDGGNRVLPLRNGTEIPTKPPLFHWLASGVADLQGEVTELGVRLPSVLAAAAVLGTVTWLGAQLFAASVGLVAALVLGSSVTFFVSATTARVDMVFTLAVTGALSVFAADVLGMRRGLGHAFHAAAAAAVLAKGPAGFVMPWAVVVAFLAATRDREYTTRLGIGAAIGWLAVPTAWYVAAFAEGGSAFLGTQLIQENFQRLVDAEGGGTGHVKPFYAHVPLLLGGVAPWSLALLCALGYAAPESLTARSRSLLLLLVWVVAPLVLLSFAGSKRAVYMLPSYPAAALLVGWWWTAQQGWTNEAIVRARRWWRRAIVATSGVLASGFMLIALAAGGLGIDRIAMPWMSEGDQANLAAIVRDLDAIRPAATSFAAVCAIAAVAMAIAGHRGARTAAAHAAAVLAIVAISGGSRTFQRAIAHSQSVDEFVTALRGRHGEIAEWRFYRDVSYPVAFYAGRPVPRVDEVVPPTAGEAAIVFAYASEGAVLQAEASGAGLVAAEVGRFTFDDNPRRDPLVAYRLARR